jgi:putative FmdB family regulatory protein
MPTYEFRCPLGHEFERFYKTMSTAPSELQCPECAAVAVRQLSGGVGLHFKGSGFYLTDYGKNAHRKRAPEGAKAEDRGATAEGAKAESATAEGGRAEGGKAEGGKAEAGKAEGGKTESPTSKPDGPTAESAKLKAQSAKPKPE